jgi:hypothetical protein
MAYAAGYSWLCGDLRTGRQTAVLPVADGSWQQVMDDGGVFSVSLALSDPDVARLNPRLVVQPARTFLCLAYNAPDGVEYLIDGGPIWTHSYDAASRKLEVGAGGVWSYYDHRFILPVLAVGKSPAPEVFAVGGLSLATIAQQLLILAHSHTGGSLPVVFPLAEAGSNGRTYPGFNMPTVGQALRDLTQVDGGPEIQFVPRRSPVDGRYIQWVMRAGTAANPLLTQLGGDHVFDFSALRTDVSGLNVDIDAGAMTMRAWVQGAGTDTATLFGRADDPTLINASGFPLLESLDANHSGDNGATVQATLDGYAREDIRAGARPVESWTAQVTRDDPPRLGEYGIGDWARFLLPADDPYIVDREVRGRITQRQGDMTPNVTLQLQRELT